LGDGHGFEKVEEAAMNRGLLLLGAMLLTVSPTLVRAAVVLEETAFIIGTNSKTYSFVADTNPLFYKVTLTDLSVGPFFGFDSLTLDLENSAGTSVGSLSGPGMFTFSPIMDELYTAKVDGIGAGIQSTGLFGLEVKTLPLPVPAPSPLILLLSPLLGFAGIGLARKRLAA
jgi:hypothetical protein